MTVPVPYFGEMLALGSAMGWAFAVILFRTAGTRVGPLALNLFKNVFALALYPPTMLLLGMALLPDRPPVDYLLLLLSGVLGMGLSDTLFLAALNRLGAGLLAIVSTLYAPTVVGLSMIFLGERLAWLQGAGVVLIVGALLLVTRVKRRPGELETRDLLVGILFSVLATLAMASSVVMVKPVLERSPIIWATMVRLAGGLLFLGPVFVLRRDRKRMLRPLADRWVLKRLVPASFVGTYLTLLLLLGSLKFALASTATVLNQLSNLFIFVFAALLLREPVTRIRVAGILLGVIGAVLVTFGT